ncbi:UNVERIFIED_CONTAM: hypothetical protein DES50_108185 [Williamsia faeni]
MGMVLRDVAFDLADSVLPALCFVFVFFRRDDARVWAWYDHGVDIAVRPVDNIGRFTVG